MTTRIIRYRTVQTTPQIDLLTAKQLIRGAAFLNNIQKTELINQFDRGNNQLKQLLINYFYSSDASEFLNCLKMYGLLNSNHQPPQRLTVNCHLLTPFDLFRETALLRKH